MSEDLANSLDLRLAWTRVKDDQDKRRAFFDHPFLNHLIESDLDPWLERIREEVGAGRYAPSTCKYVGVPKPQDAIRPGADLRLQDQVVYSALVQCLRPKIQDDLEWGNPPPDYAYQLRRDAGNREWFRLWFPFWKALDRDSISLIEKEGYEFIVTADIAGYYELIDLYVLRSYINGLGVNADALKLLETCLHRWARTPQRGIPQGYSASDVLGKLYLNSVDRSLAGDGFVHRRWVDDYRIFCKTKSEARRALIRLTDLLASRGLVLQSAKTRIISGAEATRKFRQVHALLEPVRDEMIAKLVEAGDLKGPSASAEEIDKILELTGGGEPVELLREAFRGHFIEGERFNKTLLRYLLRHLGSAKDGFALETVLEFLTEHPEETMAVLAYAQAIGAIERVEEEFISMLGDGRQVYEYQVFEVLRWRLSIAGQPSERFLVSVRDYATNRGVLWAARAVARAMLGKWGTTADLETLQTNYANAETDLERAELVCCLARMETGRRNAFLGVAAADGEIVSRAVRLVRTGRAQELLNT